MDPIEVGYGIVFGVGLVLVMMSIVMVGGISGHPLVREMRSLCCWFAVGLIAVAAMVAVAFAGSEHALWWAPAGAVMAGVPCVRRVRASLRSGR